MGYFSGAGLLLIDLQNDFLHEKGAYGRNDCSSPLVASVVSRVLPLVEAFKKHNGLVLASQFTLIPDTNGTPLIEEKLKNLRPFLGKGDFAPQSWGHDIVDEIREAVDFKVEKVAYSAFYQTRLEFVLRKKQISKLFVAGIVTNGGVASTVRDAHTRGFSTHLVADGCGAFKEEVHRVTCDSLSHLVNVTVVEQLLANIS